MNFTNPAGAVANAARAMLWSDSAASVTHRTMRPDDDRLTGSLATRPIFVTSYVLTHAPTDQTGNDVAGLGFVLNFWVG